MPTSMRVFLLRACRLYGVRDSIATTMIIDAHAHCTPTAYTAMLARIGGQQRGGEPYPTRPGVPAPPRSDEPAEIEARLALMDEAGVQMQVLSQPAGPY